jgi:hypothetical protein
MRRPKHIEYMALVVCDKVLGGHLLAYRMLIIYQYPVVIDVEIGSLDGWMAQRAAIDELLYRHDDYLFLLTLTGRGLLAK